MFPNLLGNITWIFPNLFIYSAVDRHLDCFQFEDSVENVAMNIHIQVLFCGDMFLFLLGEILSSKIAGLYDECGLSR